MALVQGNETGAPYAAPESTSTENGIKANLPMRKRKQEAIPNGNGNINTDVPSHVANSANGVKKIKTSEAQSGFLAATTQMAAAPETELKPLKRPPMPKAREIRLEQNRKAARESRRRKKIMVDELQRSVVFFSRANSTLKQQNEELQRILLHAQSQIQASEKALSAQQQATNNINTGIKTNGDTATSTNLPTANAATVNNGTNETKPKDYSQDQVHQALAYAQAQSVQNLSNTNEQTQAHQAAQVAATQAMFESQGFPPAAARAAAFTFVAAPMVANAPTSSTSTVESDNTIKSSTEKDSSQTAMINQAVSQSNFAMTAHPWPFFVTLAPGQVFANSPLAATGAPSAASANGTNHQQQQPINPYLTMQMIPFLGAGVNAPFAPCMIGLNNGNNTASQSSLNVVANNTSTNTATTVNRLESNLSSDSNPNLL